MQLATRKYKIHFNRHRLGEGVRDLWKLITPIGDYHVTEVKAYAPMRTTYRNSGPQPRAFFRGMADIHIVDGIAYLLDKNSEKAMGKASYQRVVSQANITHLL